MKPRIDNDVGRASEPVRIAVIGQAGVGKSALVVRYLTKRFIWEYDPTLECTYKHQTSIDGRSVAMEILDTSAVHDLEGNDSSDIEGHLNWADGVLLVYSVTDRSSFELALSIARRLTCCSSSNSQSPTSDKLHASDDMHPIWSSFSSSSSSESVDALVDNASSSSSPRVCSRHHRRHCVVLVGNKSDLLTERCVNVEPSPVDFVDSVSSSSSSSSSTDAKFFYETSARDGGPEIAAAFDGLCRHVLATRTRRKSGLAPIGRSTSPIDAPANELIYNQGVQQVAPQIDKRRLAVLKTVNRLVKKLHVSRSASFSVKPASSSSSSSSTDNNGQKSVRSHS